MSRIGNNPVKLPPKVEVTLAARRDQGQGSARRADAHVRRRPDDREGRRQLVFKAANDEASRHAGHAARAGRQHGQGRDRRFRAKLTLVGVGYRAQAAGDKINLSLGFSHPVVHTMPKGVKVETPVQTEIIVKGIDKQAVGQVAAEIRALSSARAVQGQGRPVCRRAREHQRNEEEVSSAQRSRPWTRKTARNRRARKTRIRIAEQRATRLVVSRSNSHIYAQIIAPEGNRVLASASTLEADVRKDRQERRQQGRGRAGRQAHRREGEVAGHRSGRIRPLRFSVSWPCARRWRKPPAPAASSSRGETHMAQQLQRRRQSAAGRSRRRSAREDDRDQPRHQGGEGRTDPGLRGADGRRRRRRPHRHRQGQGEGSAGGRAEGDGRGAPQDGQGAA